MKKIALKTNKSQVYSSTIISENPKKIDSYNLQTQYVNLTIKDFSEFINNHEFSNNKNSIKKIQNLIEEKSFEESFLVGDISQILLQHLNWLKNFPNIKPFYAMKCNNDPEILKTLAYLGCGFDCASLIEIKTILDLGVDPERIIFAHPIKAKSHLKYAYENQVNLMTFDNKEELDKIKLFHPNANLVMRILVDDSKSRIKLGEKFGVDLKNSRELISHIKSLDMKFTGVSFHAGSGYSDPYSYYDGIKKAKKIFEQAKEFGYELTLLDIGGGFPAKGKNEKKIEEFSKIVNDSIKEFFCDMDINIIAEPGRYYASSVFTLATNIIGIKNLNKKIYKKNFIKKEEEEEEEKEEEQENKKNFENKKCDFQYFINDGIYGTLSDVVFDKWEISDIKYLIKNKNNSNFEVYSDDDTNKLDMEKYSCSLWGPTTQDLDCVSKCYDMPVMNLGDWIVIPNHGAYTFYFSSGFSGVEKPRVVYINNQINLTLEKLLFEYLNKSNFILN